MGNPFEDLGGLQWELNGSLGVLRTSASGVRAECERVMGARTYGEASRYPDWVEREARGFVKLTTRC